MKMTIRHYFDFKENNKKMNSNLLTKDSWDLIRLEEDTPFSIPSNRDAWIEKCNKVDLSEFVDEVISIKNELECRSIVSVGVGIANVEYTIKQKAKDTSLICLDYAPKAIERLKNVFVECDEIDEFDMTSKDWFYRKDALYLLNRVSTEFSDEEWKCIFENMRNTGIENILYVPTEFLTAEVLIKSKIRYVINKISGKEASFAGYIRTRDTFLTFWDKYYDVKLEKNVQGYHLIVLKIKP